MGRGESRRAHADVDVALEKLHALNAPIQELEALLRVGRHQAGGGSSAVRPGDFPITRRAFR